MTYPMILAGFGVVTVMSLACRESVAQSDAALSAQVSSETASTGQSAAAKHESEAFVAEMSSPGPLAVGKDGMIVVTLKAKEGFKINDEYPIKFTLGAAPAGVVFSKSEFKRADGTFEAKVGKFEVPVKVAKAGKFLVQGTLKFSVCNDKTCLLDKRDLSAEIEAK